MVTTSKISKQKDAYGRPYYSAVVSNDGKPIATFSAVKKQALKASLKQAGYPAPVEG